MRFSYSNEGFALLGAIVERVSGQAFAGYIASRVLEPLGMERSSFDRAALTGRADVAALHAVRAGERQVRAAPRPSYLPLWYPAGGLNSTARDLTRYLEIYRTGGVSHGTRVLSEAGIARMTAGHASGTAPGTGYGYGLALRTDFHGATVVNHGGGSKGISSRVLVTAERGVSTVALANLAAMPAEALAYAPMNALLGLPVDTPTADYVTVPCPEHEMARCAGRYRGGEGIELRAGVRDGPWW